jgi:hypothetical protein
VATDIHLDKGVCIDPKKIEEMKHYPYPKTLKSWCAYLGLIGYH